MKVLIAATPLESMPWASSIGKVRFKWREGTQMSVQISFLDSLISSAEQERSRICDEWFRLRLEEIDRQQEQLFAELRSEIHDLMSSEEADSSAGRQLAAR